MSEIQKLTNAIRNYSESDLCYGTLVTLKKIDNEAMRLEITLTEAQAEIEILKNQLEDESMRADGMTTAHAEAGADSYRMRELIEQMRTTLIAARNGLLIACDDNENDSRVKRFFDYIDSALAAERGE